METADEIIKKYDLKRHTWVRKGLHSVFHTMFPAATNLIRPLNNYWGDSFKVFVYFIIEDYLHWFYNVEDMTRLRKQLVEKLNSDPDFLENHEKQWREYVKTFEQTCKKIDNTNLQELSDKELYNLYKEHYDAYVQEYALAMGLIESFSMQVDSFFRPMLEKVLENTNHDFNTVYSLLLSPVDSSFINQDFKGRLQIMKAIKENKPEVNEMLEKHAKKFHWVENNYAKVKVLDSNYFKEKINNEMKLKIDPDLELKNIDEEFENIKTKKQALISELNLSQEMQNIIKATEVFAIMQDDRKKCVLISNYYQKLFLKEMANRLNLEEKYMDYTIFPELEEIFLNKNFNKEILNKRKKASVSIETLDSLGIFEGDLALEIFNKVFNKEIEDKEIKGMCASQGKIKGIVKIIRKTHDLASVNKGEILVTSMTRPDMIIAMEKAAGIITDEGGVTCHAAVISRELNIPCIIGTKTATEILKNGDYIELDADNGIVRKIKA